MRHELGMCCGTTCDKEKNLQYVEGLEARIAELEKRLLIAQTKAEFYKDLYGQSINSIEEHFIDATNRR